MFFLLGCSDIHDKWDHMRGFDERNWRSKQWHMGAFYRIYIYIVQLNKIFGFIWSGLYQLLWPLQNGKSWCFSGEFRGDNEIGYSTMDTCEVTWVTWVTWVAGRMEESTNQPATLKMESFVKVMIWQWEGCILNHSKERNGAVFIS